MSEPTIPHALLGKIVDQCFGGAIEDDQVIRDIYAVIARESRGTDAQILLERELTASAIQGVMAIGYQGGKYPPDEAAWLRPFYELGVADAEKDRHLAAHGLWCVHVEGPDDMKPAKSKGDAERQAAEINAWWIARTDRHEYDPVINAVVKLWPYDAESHASALSAPSIGTSGDQAPSKPAAWRLRYRSEPGMIGHYPWSYQEKEPRAVRPEFEVERLFAAPQLVERKAQSVSDNGVVAISMGDIARYLDEDAVDTFAAAMKRKLAAARAKGRGGWQNLSTFDLSCMLREQVEKGDPTDVANFAMFLWSLGSGIVALPPVETTDVGEVVIEGMYRRKPVIVPAKQWFKPGDHPAVILKSDRHRYADEGIPWCPTLEGGHVVTPGDWIITGTAGENYPCKPDIFPNIYEPATRSKS